MKDDGSLLKCREGENVTMTQRERVQELRDAFEAGAEVALGQHGGLASRCSFRDHLRRIAATRYPMPRVKRPRIARDRYGREWRIDDAGSLQFRHYIVECKEWREANEEKWNLREFAPFWTELFANPTEEAEAE